MFRKGGFLTCLREEDPEGKNWINHRLPLHRYRLTPSIFDLKYTLCYVFESSIEVAKLSEQFDMPGNEGVVYSCHDTSHDLGGWD